MSGRTRTVRGRFGAAIVFALAAGLSPTAAMTVARDGRTALRVVVATEAIPAERTAAEELASYLERVTGAHFPVVPESRATSDGPTIWVGPTARSRGIGLEPGRLGPEEWRIRTVGGDLVLIGGRPRGTLYAVYRFLEDHVGVRWWTPYEEYVPLRGDLEVTVDEGGEPAFAYRDIHGVRGPVAFHARNRANGHYSFLTVAHGGNEGYGPPFMVHTFFQYLPPEEYFESHPEFYAERGGRRRGERTQLCLTNDALVDVMTARLEAFIAQAEAEAEARGEKPPRLFDVSQNDWGRPCTCEACRALDEREGGHSGSLVHFINRLADAIAEPHPDVWIDTLAYAYTFRPPRTLRLRDNVVVRLADLQYRDFSKPVTHRANREVRRAVDGWARLTRHLRIWAYTVTFGYSANNLPLPNLKVVARDFRYYRRRGVEGLFIQHDHPVLADMVDLKAWVVFKLAEDPDRDVADLVSDFTDGFYGAAGKTVREYLQALERAAHRRPVSIRFPTEVEQYRYLTPEFLRRAQSLFDRAEREVAGQSVLLRRLRHARLSLDRATLLRWENGLAQPSPHPGGGDPIDPTAVAERYRATAYERIELRLAAHQRDRARGKVDDEIATLLARIAE